MEQHQVSIIIPAYNEEQRIGNTLAAIRTEAWVKEIIVVDDGSTDRTSEVAARLADEVIRMETNQGKAAAIEVGVTHSSAPFLLLLDADLEESAVYCGRLIEPLWQSKAEMTVAQFPPALNGGFGMVKKLAAWGIYKRTGKIITSPLSGQRAMLREVYYSCYKGDKGFGLEVGITIDCLLAGYRIEEVEIPFTHREMGKGLKGFYHRMKQGLAVCQSLMARR